VSDNLAAALPFLLRVEADEADGALELVLAEDAGGFQDAGRAGGVVVATGGVAADVVAMPADKVNLVRGLRPRSAPLRLYYYTVV
jgi:hypothetical protein